MVKTNNLAVINNSGLDELAFVAKTIINDACNNIFLLIGEMGSGKTTLIREICKQLNVTDNVSSPTFSLVNEYQSDDRKVYHFDFYRVESLAEALDAGVEDYFYSGNICLIEWPEIIEDILPSNFLKVEIELIENDKRNYKLTAHESL